MPKAKQTLPKLSVPGLPPAAARAIARSARENRLTTKQTNFVAHVAAGHSQAEAYRKSYDTNPGYKRNIYRDSSLLATSPSVSQAMEQARAATLMTTPKQRRTETLEYIYETLRDAADKCRETGDYKALSNLLSLLGKHVGVQAWSAAAESTAPEPLELAAAMQAIDAEVLQFQQLSGTTIDATAALIQQSYGNAEHWQSSGDGDGI